MSLRLLDYLFGRTRQVGVAVHEGKVTYVCGYWYKGNFHVEHQATLDYVPGMFVPLPRGYRVSDMCDLRLLGVDL